MAEAEQRLYSSFFWNDVLKIIVLNIKLHYSEANFHNIPQCYIETCY